MKRKKRQPVDDLRSIMASARRAGRILVRAMGRVDRLQTDGASETYIALSIAEQSIGLAATLCSLDLARLPQKPAPDPATI